MLTRLFAGLALSLALPHLVHAADWQYCLAPADAAHKIYISPAFSSDSRGDADAMFERELGMAGFTHDDVQCPRADSEAAIVVMRQGAIGFNRQRGYELIPVPLPAQQ